jgi:hypothetical protein
MQKIISDYLFFNFNQDLPEQREHNRQSEWQDFSDQSKALASPIRGQTDVQAETQREYQDSLTGLCDFIAGMPYLFYRD